jgi:hypothetical protein
MHPRLTVAAAALLCAACAPKSESEIQVRVIYPPLPPTVCARKLMPPPVQADDRAWALYKKADSDAGDDCRDKLDAVDAVVKGWVTKTPIHGKQND